MATARLWEQGRRRIVDAGEVVVRRLPPRVQAVVRRLIDRNLLLSASSLAFYGLLSALPTLMVGFAVVSAVTGEETLQRFAQQASRSGPEGTGQFLEQLVSQGGQFNAVMLVLIVWPATAYGAGLRRVLATTSGRKDPVGFTGLRGRLLGLSFLVALPLLLLAGVPLMFVLANLSGDGALATIAGWGVALGVGTLMAALMITLLYQTFSPEELSLADSVRAAAATAFVIALFSLAFVIYLNVGHVEERFGGGTVGVVVLFGVWLFVANILMLAGYHAVAALDDADRASAKKE